MLSAQTTVWCLTSNEGPLVISPASLAMDTLAHNTAC
jgi:hypothetical protein